MARGVGVRELKAHLSDYLKKVKAGRTVLITEHGKPVGRIVPAGQSCLLHWRKLLASNSYQERTRHRLCRFSAPSGGIGLEYCLRK